jgi:hypothetical protein
MTGLFCASEDRIGSSAGDARIGIRHRQLIARERDRRLLLGSATWSEMP